jgi:hypothetical protein
MEYLILTHPEDLSALQVAAALRRRWGHAAVGVVSAATLAMAPKWSFSAKISSPGVNSTKLDTHSEVQLAGGMRLESGQIRVIFNRLRYTEVPHFSGASPADREYAEAEMNALWVSWLAGLQLQGSMVINPIQRGNLQPGYSRLEWLNLAGQAGMACEKYFASSQEEQKYPGQDVIHRTLIAGKHCAPLDSGVDFDSEFQAKIRKLQDLSGCKLLEISTRTAAENTLPGNNPLVVAINPFPDFDRPAALEAAVKMLEGSAGR